MAIRERLDATLERCIKSIDTWQQLITENFEDEQEKNEEQEKLKNCVKMYCEVDQLIKKTDDALEKVDNELNEKEATGSEDINKMFQDFFENEPTSSSQNYANSRIWKSVFGRMSDVMEVKQKKKKIDDTHFEELSDSMMCSNVFTPPIDPITKTVVRNPYKNKRCKHVYEHGTIVGYIKQLKSKAKCPYIGCNNNQLRVTDLVADTSLQSQITEYLETQEAEESDDDDE
ncbi:uncharacterized protein [Leptinotarsa decemlineata]|uniref:uncharacterized protein n=1 Tax=Leptinotarsa decemlineata TaxID=7539 RepID=UPI000C2546A3|nr:E3 SUMO-protein ligase NSE2-like [Leptinotarsa decemlineata]